MMFEELAWFILAVILVTLIVNRFNTTRNLPPGPFPLPIIGNAHKLAADSRHVDLMELEKQFGKVFRLYLGSQLVIVVTGGNALKEVLVTKSAEFAGRPSFYTADVYFNHGKAIALADYSLALRLHRKVAVSALKTFSNSKLKKESIINDEFDLLLKRVRSRNGKPHDITKDVRLAVTNVMCALVFGSRYELDDPEFDKVLDILSTLATMVAAGSLVDVFPWMRFIPLNSIQNLKEKCEERDELFGRIYREHVEANKIANPQNLTDALLKAKKEAEDDCSMKGFLTDQNIIRNMSDVFMAGLETTASTVCWVLLYLIHNPVAQQKLRQELDQVIGPDRLPEFEDKKNLPYLEATITETLRISSLTPLSGPHKTTVDTTLQGYSIPKGTTVLTNLWSFHHDPDIWDDPDVFRPERFLDEEGNFVPPDNRRFLPFSAGHRVCVGESLARIELFLILSRLLQSFKFESPPGCGLPTLEPVAGIVLMPRPFKVCALNRHAV